MQQNYYEPKDLADFPNITEFAPEQGTAFFDYYAKSTSAGSLTEREKSLIALSVATVRHCPYCIDAYTNKCLSLGVSNDEMMEAVHVGAAMVAGDILAHSTQMRKIIKERNVNLMKIETPGPVPQSSFSWRLGQSGLLPFRAVTVDILQINVGRRCNLSCKHCHMEAGPDRTEVMTRGVLEKCLEAARHPAISVIDITGGAPEMNPELPWFIEEAAKLKKRLIVRSNLVVLLETGGLKFIDLYCRNNVEIVGSLPDLHAEKTDRQRGAGVFGKEVTALRRLNDRGYGINGSKLVLNLVHNPVGAILPGSQKSIEHEYKRRLWESYGIRFNNLFSITNNPVGRFLSYLVRSGNYEEYRGSLSAAFNQAAARNVMCRSMLSVGWDGTLYDCDFNQALDMPVDRGAPDHIDRFDADLLLKRAIVVADHCFACTAGAGSSCRGAVKG